MSRIFRTDETQAAYEAHNRLHHDGVCPLCTTQPLTGFTFWKIIPNDFPYDRVAKVHHMIVPLRHVVEDELSDNEREEFKKIKKEVLFVNYQHLIEGCESCKSIPGHFHIHLLVEKESI